MTTDSNFLALVNKVKTLLTYDDFYIESQLWASRNEITSITDIRLAIAKARGTSTPINNSNLRYKFTHDSKFIKAENKIREAADSIRELLIQYTERYSLPTDQSNDLLMFIEGKMRVFSQEPLNQLT